MTHDAAQAFSVVPGELELRALLAETLKLTDTADLDPDANLVLLGLSSIQVMRMVGRWNKSGVPADLEVLMRTPTLGSWLAFFAGLETDR